MNIRRKGVGLDYCYEHNSKARNFYGGAKFMARRFMKISMLAIMNLVILTLVDVHANDRNLDDPFDLHIAQIKFINSLIYAFEICHEVSEDDRHAITLEACAFRVFDQFVEENRLPVNHHVVEVASKCLKLCLDKKHMKPFRLEACFIKCYKKHLKEHVEYKKQDDDHNNDHGVNLKKN